MNEWIITPERYSGECQHFFEGDCGALEDKKCNFEDCPINVDKRPITAGWLGSLGISSQNIQDECERFTARYGRRGLSKLHVDFYFNSSKVEVWHQVRSGSFNGEILPHIKTRHQFKRLFEDLSGKGLGDE